MDREQRSVSGRLRTCAFVLLALLGATAPAHARTTIVPDDFPTIQAAADALYEPSAGDTLLVRGGNYPERVVFRRGIHVEAIPSLDGSDNVARIQGLEAQSDGGEYFLFIGLHFTGNVQHGPTNGPDKLHFIGCRFDDGMSAYTFGNDPDTDEVRLTRCTLYQTVSMCAWACVVDSCSAYGPVVIFTPWRAVVADNTFDAAGNAVAIHGSNVLVARNRVRGGMNAFTVEPDDGLDVQIVDNDVEGCRGHGIFVSGVESDGVLLERNRIARCGSFGARASGSVTARNNRVSDCRGPGLELLQDTGTGIAEGNVVARCDGAGIRLAYHSGYGDAVNVSVRQNTVYGCTGPGIAISGLPGSTITHNIVYACLGVSAVGSDPLDVSCNDWFPMNGTPALPSDLSVDPQFCDFPADDVHLRSDSPLLDAPGCGLIGSLGQGCEAPPIAIGLGVWPRALPAAPRGRWVTAWLEPGSPYTASDIEIATVRLNDVPVASSEGMVGDRDRDGIPDLELRFDRIALGRTLPAGREVTLTITGRIRGRDFTGTDVVLVPPANGVGRSAVPRPGERVVSIRASGTGSVANGLRLSFTLADESPAHLDMLDVAGRVVVTRDIVGREPGEHLLDLGHEGIAQGIYFLRLRQGLNEARTRCVVMR